MRETTTDGKPLHRHIAVQNLGYGTALDSIVEWTLTPVAGGTRARMEHSGVGPQNASAYETMSSWSESRSLDREVLIAAQPDFAVDGNEPDGAGRGTRDVEERSVGLRVQIAVVLLGATP